MIEIAIAIIVAAGGTGGVVTFYKAWTDYREKKESREDGADDRMIDRLERRLTVLEKQHESDANYILVLVSALSRAGIEVPARKETA